MLQIENKDKFGKVIADSLSKVEQAVTDPQTKKRWINAIAKAVVEIEENGVFMTWQEADKSLLIWSQKSNNIYAANGVCQCRAFEQGSPCFHRAAAPTGSPLYGSGKCAGSSRRNPVYQADGPMQRGASCENKNQPKAKGVGLCHHS